LESAEDNLFLQLYYNDGIDVNRCISELYKSVAQKVIIPLQDILKLDNESRTCFSEEYQKSWLWRALPEQLNSIDLLFLQKLSILSGRYSGGKDEDKRILSLQRSINTQQNSQKTIMSSIKS
jgi:hypothetical protein